MADVSGMGAFSAQAEAGPSTALNRNKKQATAQCARRSPRNFLKSGSTLGGTRGIQITEISPLIYLNRIGSKALARQNWLGRKILTDKPIPAKAKIGPTTAGQSMPTGHVYFPELKSTFGACDTCASLATVKFGLVCMPKTFAVIFTGN